MMLLRPLIFAALATLALAGEPPLDRQALVTRHNPVIRKVDYDSPLTVGNGGFAFTADITGLQTFPAQYYRDGLPLETLARWCWVSDPNPHHYTLADTDEEYTLPGGRKLGFPTRQDSPAADWLRRNPRLHPLGQLALEWDKADGSPFVPADVQEPEQTLDLWRGIITSRYKLGGTPVVVTTACAPDSDTVVVRIESDLVATGKLRARLAFPFGHDPAVKLTPPFDWSHPEAHGSRLIRPGEIQRQVCGTKYYVACNHELRQTAPHHFRIETGAGGRVLAFTVAFSATEPAAADPAPDWWQASARHWENFWRRGAAVDFTGSTDPRAGELEGRIILSRYLMAAQMAGDMPPQESGLTCNTWYGKHHTEMIWWHTAQFALWGDDPLLEKNLAWYRRHLPEARALAKSRGLDGARWAKMVGPDDRESPGGNPLIAWNQPHLIYLCELLYRNHPAPEVLGRYRDLVLETAGCLASMLHRDQRTGQYNLGPPLWIAQEIHDPATSRNPAFELAYWRWALGVAQQWRERLGLPRQALWDDVRAHLAPLPEKDGKYVALESHPDTWDNIASRHDHPAMLMALGFLPGEGVDRTTMARTLDAVLATWDWKTKIWGWDYPMIAMTAARLGRPETALEILLRDGPNNHYLPNGHCPQRSETDAVAASLPGGRRHEIAAYLPANGAFLTAVALMVAGWDGAPRPFPGFPHDGSWVIRSEGLKPLP